MKKLIAVLIFLFILTSTTLALDIPQPNGYINDFANVIDDSVEEELETIISAFEEKTSNEITVVTITSLEGENLEDYSIRLAEDWGVGKAEYEEFRKCWALENLQPLEKSANRKKSNKILKL